MGQIRKIGQIVALMALCLVVGFLLAHPINLATADLGRHIKNGELIVSELKTAHSFSSVVYKNTYSYTNADFASPNHHWASGVVFFYLQKWFGFVGLSVWYIATFLLAFLIMFYISSKTVGFLATFVSSLFILPLLIYRDEVRPEVWSYVFVSSYTLMLWKHMRTGKKWYLYLLLLLQVLWVNLHIYFFLGFIVTGAFLLHYILYKNWYGARVLAWLLVLLVLVSLVSPLGLIGLLYPFQILGHYGYRVLENQSIFFLRNLHIEAPGFIFLEINFFLLIFGFMRTLVKKKVDMPWVWWLALAGNFLGLFAVRNLALCGLLSIPALAQNFGRMALEQKRPWVKTMPVYLAIVLVIIFSEFCLIYPSELGKAHALGLADGVLGPGQFIQANGIVGPIFNNYDIGGLLIYELQPLEKVFVDNRPEGYPEEFFRDVYVPMQEDPVVWQAKLGQYHFNAIIFNWHDATPWAQTFLARIINDPAWAPVYVDNYTLIVLRRNGVNEGVIEKHELPKSLFRFK